MLVLVSSAIEVVVCVSKTVWVVAATGAGSVTVESMVRSWLRDVLLCSPWPVVGLGTVEDLSGPSAGIVTVESIVRSLPEMVVL